MTLQELAGLENRDYVTPEDVQAAIDAGMDKLALYTELLRFIEKKSVEDTTLAAFVALQFERETMATKLEGFRREYELGEWVSFEHEGRTLRGEVVRVYSARDDYHVEVDGQRYSTHIDEMRPAKKPEAEDE